MNDSERLQLQKMIQANDAEDNTPLIRSLKHSKLIWADVNTILTLKKKYADLEKNDPHEFNELCTGHANFLFTTYTDIFNKVIKNEINLDILLQLINVLKAIEEGACDQHEGSFAVGKILKEMYVDSALRKSENAEASTIENNKKGIRFEEPEKQEESMENISWEEFKKMSMK